MWNLHKQITLRVYESGNYKSATESRKFMGRVTMAKGWENAEWQNGCAVTKRPQEYHNCKLTSRTMLFTLKDSVTAIGKNVIKNVLVLLWKREAKVHRKLLLAGELSTSNIQNISCILTGNSIFHIFCCLFIFLNYCVMQILMIIYIYMIFFFSITLSFK